MESGFIFFRIRCRIRRIRVDGSRIRKEKVADSKISGTCGRGPSEHHQGITSKFCQGEEKSSPSQGELHGGAEFDEEIFCLEYELAALPLGDEKRAKQRRVLALQREIEEKRSKLHASSGPRAEQHCGPEETQYSWGRR